MEISQPRMRAIAKALVVTAIVVSAMLLVVTITILIREEQWRSAPANLRGRDAFTHGAIGTELLPLPVLVALPDLAPEHFGSDDGWIERYGFIRAQSVHGLALPMGFEPLKRRPQSGAPSPVDFVGFSCILCHSTQIRTGDPERDRVVMGPGNSALNLFGWLDAFQAAMLDDKLVTGAKVQEAYQRRTGKTLSFEQKVIVDFWIRTFRKTLQANVLKYDEPFGRGDSLKAEFIPSGPGRTQPFRTIVRRALNRPGAGMPVFTKIATVYQQDRREWAQFDGSVRDLHARSAYAAYAAGATVDALATTEVAHNVREASDYTRTLLGPSFSEIFGPESISADRAQAGRTVYLDHCSTCHGRPDGETWVKGARQGEVIGVAEIKTDPERVTYRYAERIPDALHELFPPKHPFRIGREDLRPGPLGETLGYINAPIERVYSRAPFLHNGSVPTLAHLINLKPRPASFYRGAGLYDRENLGVAAPLEVTHETPFYFDTRLRGNANTGHDYPWRFDDPKRDEQHLRDLLEYLKTL